MSRPLAREIAIFLASVFAVVGLAPARGDDPKPQAEKKVAQAAGPKETGRKETDKAAPAASSPAKLKDATSKEGPTPVAPGPVAGAGPKAVSFIKDVAPILVENCIACHNPRKSESKYVMTTFTQLAKGGQQGEGVTLAPGKPDESFLVELIRPAGQPRMPYKQDPLPAEKIATIERWVAEGAKYDGGSAAEDWTIYLRKTQNVSVPESYPAAVPITALEFTRDGSAVAASGYHEVTFWKTADGTLARRLGGLAERTYDVAYSPDGKWMATASGDPGIFGVARLWAAEPGPGAKPVRDLVETQDVVFSVAFSPDSKRLATAGADRAIRIYEVETGKLLFQVEDHADWIFAVAFSPDGKRLASASRDKTCKVFDVEKKESLVTFPGHAQPVYTIAFSPDGKTVASGGEDGEIRVWNPDADGKQVRELIGFGGTVFRLRYSPDGQVLAACSAGKTVQVFKASGGLLRKLQGQQDWIYSLAISPDSKTIASGSWDGDVRLWNLADGKPIRNFTAAPGYKPAATTKAAAR
jgi:tricorn protease-like protein/mono/diheme cytochrome c family protein